MESGHFSGCGTWNVATFQGVVHGKWSLSAYGTQKVITKPSKKICFVTVLLQHLLPITFRVPYHGKCSLSEVWYIESEYFP